MAVKDQVDEMFAGNKRVQRFTITDDDTAGSPPKDLTGLDIKYALSRFDDEGNFLVGPVLTKDVAGGGIIVTDAVNGVLEVTFLKVDTQALAGDFYFELEAFDGTLESTVLATGTLTIIKNVVNP